MKLSFDTLGVKYLECVLFLILSTSLHGHTICVTNKAGNYLSKATYIIGPEPKCCLKIVCAPKCSFNLVLTGFKVQIFISFTQFECLPA